LREGGFGLTRKSALILVGKGKIGNTDKSPKKSDSEKSVQRHFSAGGLGVSPRKTIGWVESEKPDCSWGVGQFRGKVWNDEE